ncbi:CD1375 family protein (plasmid) [Priestia megaterium]
MVMIYVYLVEKGVRSIDSVPASLREEVKRVLAERQQASTEQSISSNE